MHKQPPPITELSETVIIRGSSYFLSKSSAVKLGVSRSETSFLEKLNILLNFLDLIWIYSLTIGELTFPSLGNIHAVRIKLAVLSR